MCVCVCVCVGVCRCVCDFAYLPSVLHIIIYISYIKSESRYEKTDFCICENKDADQLRSNCAADQRLCFRNTDGTIPLRSKSEILSF